MEINFPIWRIDLSVPRPVPRGLEVRVFFALRALYFNQTAYVLFLYYEEVKLWVE